MSTTSQQWGQGEEGQVGRAMLWKDGGSSSQALPAPLTALISLLKGSKVYQDAKSGFPVKDILAGLGSNLGQHQIKKLFYILYFQQSASAYSTTPVTKNLLACHWISVWKSDSFVKFRGPAGRAKALIKQRANVHEKTKQWKFTYCRETRCSHFSGLNCPLDHAVSFKGKAGRWVSQPPRASLSLPSLSSTTQTFQQCLPTPSLWTAQEDISRRIIHFKSNSQRPDLDHLQHIWEVRISGWQETF